MDIHSKAGNGSLFPSSNNYNSINSPLAIGISVPNTSEIQLKQNIKPDPDISLFMLLQNPQALAEYNYEEQVYFIFK